MTSNIPDTTKEIVVSSSPFNAPTNGWITGYMYADWATSSILGFVHLNNKIVANHTHAGGDKGKASTVSSLTRVGAGQTIAFDNLVTQVRFYPDKESFRTCIKY